MDTMRSLRDHLPPGSPAGGSPSVVERLTFCAVITGSAELAHERREAVTNERTGFLKEECGGRQIS
jgi:hypothetical protein